MALICHKLLTSYQQLYTHFEKYLSKLDISRSFVCICGYPRIYPALAVKYIETSFIYFARLFLFAVSREYILHSL